MVVETSSMCRDSVIHIEENIDSLIHIEEKFLLHAYMESPTTHKILKNGRRDLG